MELLIQVIVVIFVSGIILFSFKYFSGINYNSVTNKVKERKNLIVQIGVIIVVCSFTLFLTNTQIKKAGKDMYINSFEKFVEKVQENYKDYSEEDWAKIEEEYEKLSEKKRLRYDKLFTKEDKKRINKLEGEYLSYRAGGFFDNVIEKTKDVINNAAEYVDGFMKGLNNEIENDTTNE